jgi:MYXO-CTERM domain-containing protein
MSARSSRFPGSNGLRLTIVCLFLTSAGFAATDSHAGTVTFVASGSGSDGPDSATVTFTSVAGGIKITITNTETTGTLAKGQAISSLSFKVNGISTPSAFTEMKGASFNPVSGGSWTSASGTPFDDTSSASPPNAIDHWGFGTSGSTVTLATAGSPVPGAGNAHFMILPSSGTAAGGSALANSNFFPYEIGTATFFLTVAGVTASTDLTNVFTKVKVGFGTGPDNTFTGVPPPSPPPQIGGVPEPASLAVWGLLGLAGFIGVRRRKSETP